MLSNTLELRKKMQNQRNKEKNNEVKKNREKNNEVKKIRNKMEKNIALNIFVLSIPNSFLFPHFFS